MKASRVGAICCDSRVIEIEADEQYLNALSVAGPRAWNALPSDIRCAPSLNTFKKRLKSHQSSAAYEL